MGSPIVLPAFNIQRRHQQQRQAPTRDEVRQTTQNAIDQSMGDMMGNDEDIDSSPSMNALQPNQDDVPDPGTRELVIPRVSPDEEESIDDSLVSRHPSIQAISAQPRDTMRVQQPEGIESSPQAMTANPLARIQQPMQRPPTTAQAQPQATNEAMWEPDINASPQSMARTEAPQEEAQPQAVDELDQSPQSAFEMTPEERQQLADAQKRQRRERIAGGVITGVGALTGLIGAATGNPVAAQIGAMGAGGGAAIANAKPADAVQAGIRQRQAMEAQAQDRQLRRMAEERAASQAEVQSQQANANIQRLADEAEERRAQRERDLAAGRAIGSQLGSLQEHLPEERRLAVDPEQVASLGREGAQTVMSNQMRLATERHVPGIGGTSHAAQSSAARGRTDPSTGQWQPPEDADPRVLDRWRRSPARQSGEIDDRTAWAYAHDAVFPRAGFEAGNALEALGIGTRSQVGGAQARLDAQQARQLQQFADAVAPVNQLRTSLALIRRDVNGLDNTALAAMLHSAETARAYDLAHGGGSTVQDARARLFSVVIRQLRETSGQAVTGPEERRFFEQLNSGTINSGDAFRHQLNRIYREAVERQNGIVSGLPGGRNGPVYQAWAENMRAMRSGQ